MCLAHRHAAVQRGAFRDLSRKTGRNADQSRMPCMGLRRLRQRTGETASCGEHSIAQIDTVSRPRRLQLRRASEARRCSGPVLRLGNDRHRRSEVRAQIYRHRIKPKVHHDCRSTTLPDEMPRVKAFLSTVLEKSESFDVDLFKLWARGRIRTPNFDSGQHLSKCQIKVNGLARASIEHPF